MQADSETRQFNGDNWNGGGGEDEDGAAYEIATDEQADGISFITCFALIQTIKNRRKARQWTWLREIHSIEYSLPAGHVQNIAPALQLQEHMQ